MADRKNSFLFYVTSFLVPILLMVVLFAQKQIWPGGPFTVLHYDLEGQYLPIYASLRYTDHFFYNTYGALGESFLGTYAYYLGNPLMWLSTLFPLKTLPDFLYFAEILKIGLAGLTFCIFLDRSEERQNAFGLFLLPICYALMSYNIMYSMCLMWMDGVVLLPLILLGVGRLAVGKGPWLYLITLALCLICNYYIAWMCGIAAGVYLLERLLTSRSGWSDRFRALGSLAGTSLLGLGFSMPLVLPALEQMLTGKLEESASHRGLLLFSPLALLRKFLPGEYDTIYTEGLPSLYCGSLALLLTVLYLLNRKTSLRQRLCGLGILVFYFTGLLFTPLYDFFHGMREPNCFPGRFTFTFCAFLLLFSYRALPDVCRYLKEHTELSELLAAVGVFFTVAELFLNGSIVLSGLNIEAMYHPRELYEAYLDTGSSLVELAENDSDSFCRIAKNYAYTNMDGYWLGYSGLDHFSSSYNLKAMNLFGDLGMLQYRHYLHERGLTPVSESFFGVRYYLSVGETRPDLEVVSRLGSYTVYRNDLALPVAFWVDEGALDASPFTENAFENQNLLLSELTGDSVTPFEIFPLEEAEALVPGEAEETFTPLLQRMEADFVMPEAGELWFSMGTVEECFVAEPEGIYHWDPDFWGRVSVNGSEPLFCSGKNSSYIVNLGYFEAGEVLHLLVESVQEFSGCSVAILNRQVVAEALTGLRAGGMADARPGEGCVLKGTVTADEAGTLFFTIPYEKGLEVLIDGKQTELSTYRNALICVQVPEGTHTVSLRYVPYAFYWGLVVMALSLAFVLVLSVRAKSRRR